MTVYFDTSAIMRFLMRHRSGHEAVMAAWLAANEVASVHVTYAETRAALARARAASAP
jgi:hypothetical protein